MKVFGKKNHALEYILSPTVNYSHLKRSELPASFTAVIITSSKKLIKFLEAVFPQSPQAFPISLPDPTIGLSRPYVCSFFLFLGCFHLFIEDPKSLDQDIDRSVFITIMFCSTNRTDPGMNVQVLDFLVLVSADIT